MQALFIHQNFPAQFGGIARYMHDALGWSSVFLSRTGAGKIDGVDRLRYAKAGGATARTHYCARNFENAVAEASAVHRALKDAGDRIHPDVIVGHSGFGSTIFLRDLYPGVPIVNYFEYYYHSHGVLSDAAFRSEWPREEMDVLRTRTRNAMILLDLENADAAYTPTGYQASLFPDVYRPKLEIVHDGVPTRFWRRTLSPDRTFGEVTLPATKRVVTYVSRGFESMRGFDVFMELARRLCDTRDDVEFLVVGEDRICYGPDQRHVGPSFKSYVLSRARYDLSRIHFVGRLQPADLVRALSISDLHVYLTVPFVLSWSLLDAMSCECVVLASDTAPVREVLRHKVNGLLAGFHDLDALVEGANAVLDAPERSRSTLGAEARRTIVEKYDESVTLPRIGDLLQRVALSRHLEEPPPSLAPVTLSAEPQPRTRCATAAADPRVRRAIGLYYAADAFEESPGSRQKPTGILGRRVAGVGFLDALLKHGTWQQLVAVVPDAASEKSLRSATAAAASNGNHRDVQFLHQARAHSELVPASPVRTLHFPDPLTPRYGWLRRHGRRHAFALSGLTHTICSLGVVERICSWVTGPYEDYDAVICTSRAVASAVRRIAGEYIEYLRQHFRGSYRVIPILPVIPLGVDVDRMRPPSMEERTEARLRYQFRDDEVVALFVGRLSFHAKANPYSMLASAAAAARTSKRPVRLVFCGWTASADTRSAFEACAAAFDAELRTSFVDGQDPEVRRSIWHSADLFVSLSDNFQESFGLAVAEAMASGLAVVASDWDGYRDIVRDGIDGFLVPTKVVAGSMRDSTARLLLGAIQYDQFVAETSQAVAIDLDAAASALTRLVADDGLRRALGEAARQRAVDQFSWRRVVASYEQLWDEQATACRAAASRDGCRPYAGRGPAVYPVPDFAFGSYATQVLGGDIRLRTSDRPPLPPAAAQQLVVVRHSAEARSAQPRVLELVCESAKRGATIYELDALLLQSGTSFEAGRATIAWLLKYGFLRVDLAVDAGAGA